MSFTGWVSVTWATNLESAIEFYEIMQICQFNDRSTGDQSKQRHHFRNIMSHCWGRRRINVWRSLEIEYHLVEQCDDVVCESHQNRGPFWLLPFLASRRWALPRQKLRKLPSPDLCYREAEHWPVLSHGRATVAVAKVRNTFNAALKNQPRSARILVVREGNGQNLIAQQFNWRCVTAWRFVLFSSCVLELVFKKLQGFLDGSVMDLCFIEMDL